ncbi:nitroreductase family protein [Phenylobacterium sp.]|jgi:3-hydroxypropanoate dehydrogenase|uniref:nitroreductase family protein n=1 Tax=Phenylobacterium sp. TaxID=1871053 RepID=UPI002E2FAC84|nr:nitroreductase family protein [Phenylobacterium sp.]HEX2560559.1 nitroreductase family protein [Phenylobacterium sp.]
MGSVVPLHPRAPAPPPLDQLFRAAAPVRFSARPVPRATLDELFALVSLGPSGAEGSAARYVFIVSPAARARLSRLLPEAARGSVEAAPACALVGYDDGFAELLMGRSAPAPHWRQSRLQLVRETAARNRALQGAWLIIAARTLGLEAAPLAEFDGAAVTKEFLGDVATAQFLCVLGYPEAP